MLTFFDNLADRYGLTGPIKRKHPDDLVPLVDEQKEALTLLHSGVSVFLTGEAGTGKTFLVNRYVREARARGRRVAVTASTGIAASHIAGQTINSFFGSGLNKRPVEQIVGDKSWQYKSRQIAGHDVLILDEISMVDGKSFQLYDDLARHARCNGRPFGGMQVVLVGDMGQLPPVEADTRYFAFASRSWWDLNPKKVELKHVHRQSDAVFSKALGEVRVGKPSPETIALLRSRLNAFDPEAEPLAARLLTTNDQVDRVNLTRLESLPLPEFTYHAKEWGPDWGLRQLDDSCLSPRILRLRPGARIMTTRNAARDPDTGFPPAYCNGSLGTFIREDETHRPVVRFDSGLECILEQECWVLDWGPMTKTQREERMDDKPFFYFNESEDDLKEGDAQGFWKAWGERHKLESQSPLIDTGRLQAVRWQYPLKLAWAVTTHKCVSPSTWVITDHGMEQAGNLQPVGNVYTPTGLAAYSNFVSNPTGPMLKIRTRRGFELCASPDHKVAVSTGFFDLRVVIVPVSLVRVGALLRIIRGGPWPAAIATLPAPTRGDVREEVLQVYDELDVDIAELFGLLVADGVFYHNGFRLAKRHVEVVDRVSDTVERYFGKQPKRWQGKNCWFVEVNSSYLRRWLSSVGGFEPNRKHIPSAVLRANEQVTCAFLRGLFEDGSCHVKDGHFSHIEFTTAYEDMSLLVQLMLLRVGIFSSRKMTVRVLRGVDHRLWRIWIYGSDAGLFRDKIGFISKCKQDGLASAGSCHKETPTVIEDSVVSIEATTGESVCVSVPECGCFVQNGIDGCNSQGMSLDRASINLSRVWAGGQAYVALSRVRTLEGLNIEAWTEERCIFPDKRVMDFLNGWKPEGY